MKQKRKRNTICKAWNRTLLDTMSKKSVEEPAIEKPVKQPAPKIDKSNAVNFHITDDALEQAVRKRNSDEI